MILAYFEYLDHYIVNEYFKVAQNLTNLTIYYYGPSIMNYRLWTNARTTQLKLWRLVYSGA